MAAQKQKKAASESANASTAVKNAKGAAAGSASPSPASRASAEPERVPASTSAKPDKAAFEAEKARIQSEIEALQTKLNAVREKLSQGSKPDAGKDRRAALIAELDTIRGQQSSSKTSRGKILDQVKTLQDKIQKQVKDLQAARAKTSFRTVAEVDAHIESLEKQVESGTMKLAEEKRAILEISQIKRSRKVIEGCQSAQNAIEADRRAVDDLRKQLDDPEAKAMSDRYDAIKAELDELKKEADEAYASRSKIIEERDSLQAHLTELYNQKRESSQLFREANDRYWAKVNEDRARRAERARAQRAADEARKKLEIAERLREEAALPAFQAQIEDCQTLIDALSGKTGTNVVLPSQLSSTRAVVVGVPQLELRKVEDVGEGMVARKKKGEEEEAYFIGKQKKGKKEKVTKSESGHLNLPLPVLKALLSLAIPAPSGTDDVARVIEDLKTKKAWFEANQARVTAENVAKAEAEIQRLTTGLKKDSDLEATTPSRAESPPNDTDAEPATPAESGGTTSVTPDAEADEDTEQ
ncbi:hypothetical protein ID866_6788 [Astraeus odoratus]|nr:hypothetical protein ID866_6788 [Astraeus odoratus]